LSDCLLWLVLAYYYLIWSLEFRQPMLNTWTKNWEHWPRSNISGPMKFLGQHFEISLKPPQINALNLNRKANTFYKVHFSSKMIGIISSILCQIVNIMCVQFSFFFPFWTKICYQNKPGSETPHWGPIVYKVVAESWNWGSPHMREKLLLLLYLGTWSDTIRFTTIDSGVKIACRAVTALPWQFFHTHIWWE
jgi:hypothetical protein